ncbi:putative DNA helicase [Anaerospora hongkongensis]|uniref:Putative DNA helicase n=1 Tax=Anaerospora hongkongensis TaxID=244830 RepID=A0A4R1Q8Y7_9FIRM|nr:serine/threonine-protein kinase [Anaerospora hongkongensis]TCL38871.1 putative DNA helicase [Anaerospora hongkongensis]
MSAQYEILDVLHENPHSNSKVILVRDKITGKEFVIKRIIGLDNPLHRAIFDKEIGALYKLRQSEHIVKLLDYKQGKSSQTGVFEGRIFLEYVDGDTLQNKCSQIINIGDKFNVIQQLVSALRYAHESGIIHRDINPKNIMVTEDGRVKLIDFGICKIKGMSIKGTTFRYATNKYAAPEVGYHSENATERSDIYSLGSVIYFMFTKNEPTVPDNMSTAIKSASGIDPLLKDVLIRMTSINPLNRFENMIDLEISLSPLYKKYLNNNEAYCVTIDSAKFEFLRKNNLVKAGKTNDQLMKEDISSNFTNATVFMEKRVDQVVYIFDGINYSMHCDYDEASQLFKVLQFKRIEAFYRERNKKTYMAVSGIIVFQNSFSAKSWDHNNYQLLNRISDHIDAIRSKKNINIEYTNNYGFWYDFIKIMKEDVRKRAAKFYYDRYEYKNNLLYFTLNKDTYIDAESLSTISVLICETATNNDISLKEIGTFEKYIEDGNIMVIKPTRNSEIRRLPRSGYFCADYRMEIAQYKKQERALDEFQREEYNCHGNLKSIFVGLEAPEIFPNSRTIKYFDHNLDDAQKMAIRKILDARDIVLIQGPPGTGKTNVIVELIRQIRAHNQKNPTVSQKVLIVSQSHAAVDKILEDLDPYVEDVNVIRIGYEEKISLLSREKYSLDNKKKTWVENIVCKSRKNLENELMNRGIDFSSFEQFMIAFDDLQISNRTAEEETANTNIISDFYQKYKIGENDKEFRRLIIIQNWMRQLIETNNIEEYFIRNASIVVGTCSGFAANPFVNDTIFDYVIVDEAAKATLPEMMVSLVKSKKVVLVGDHMQLPPVFDQGAISRADTKISIDDLKNGSFERIFNILPEACKQVLSTQYRMHPVIGEMIGSIFYGNKLQNGVGAEERELDLPSFKNYAMAWMSTSSLPGCKRFEHKISNENGDDSYVNYQEASILLELIKKLDLEIGDKGYSIGVITPYRAQLNRIQREIALLELKNISVEANTVDAFQGSQKDIILYSTVRSSDLPRIGFLREHARINVSFSRAKRLLVIIGDMEFLNNPNIPMNKFPEIIEYMLKHKDSCHIIQYGGDK